MFHPSVGDRTTSGPLGPGPPRTIPTRDLTPSAWGETQGTESPACIRVFGEDVGGHLLGLLVPLPPHPRMSEPPARGTWE